MWRLVVVLAFGSSVSAALAGESERQGTSRIKVDLRASKASYLVGEPVLLRVAVTNLEESPLTFLEPAVQHREPEIDVHISRDGKEFRPYLLGIAGVVMRPYTVCTLQPGGVWQCEMRVLYDAHQPGNLAFLEAGEYWVKVVYPLYFGRFRPSSVLRQESNVVRLNIRDPEGEDIHVWKILRSPPVLAFLQTGGGGRTPEIPAKMLEVLPRARGSAYEAPIRWALREYHAREARSINSWWNDPLKRHTLQEIPKADRGKRARRRVGAGVHAERDAAGRQVG